MIEYLKVNLADVSYHNGKLLVGQHLYRFGPSFPASLGKLFGFKVDTKTTIDLINANNNVECIIYTANGIAIAIFKLGTPYFSPVDSLALYKRLAASGMLLPYRQIALEQTQLLVFERGKDINFGVLLTVPHTGLKPITFQTAINHQAMYIVLPDKNSTWRVKLTDDNLNWLTSCVRGGISQINSVVGPWLNSRWEELRRTSASLEECLELNKLTNNHMELNLDSILAHHGLSSPSDAWIMFRRQANTPYNRLNLLLALANYASHIKNVNLMLKAGTFLLNKGDLEARPAWINWANL